MAHTPNAVFDEIVATFDAHPPCAIQTNAGGQCRRPARWHMNVHGCQRVNVCGHHKSHWERRTRTDLRFGAIHCDNCGTDFTSFDDTVRIVAI